MASTPVTILAHGGNSGKQDGAKFELKIKDQLGEDKNEAEIENEEENNEEVNNNKQANNQRFEIKGEISSISGNTFVVLGQTITIDSTKVNEFEQKGILQVGKTVKVEGIIENNVKFAREINVIGTGQGRFRFEINAQGLSLTPSPSSTPSSNVRVEVKAKGPADAVVEFLKQILSFFTNVV